MKRKGYILLTIQFHQEKDKRWTAKCIELGTASFGNSLKDAEVRIKEAIDLHIVTLEEEGELEKFFVKHKIKFYHEKPKEARVPIIKNSYIHIEPYRIPAFA